MYHDKDIKDIFKALKTSEKGLSEKEAKNKFGIYGPNEIKEAKKISPWKIFFSQFKSFIIYILIIAVVISAIVGYKEYLEEGGSIIKHFIDSIVILIILILNAILGFIQEYKAEKAIEALKKLASLKARVVREGKESIIDAKELVPGDIILLESGEKIPADSRLIETVNLQCQEASLTGESVPVKKELSVLAEKTALADRKNMVFSGTVITNGRGKAVVVATGMNTELGKIAHLIQKEEPQLTPLQKKLHGLGKWIGLLTIVIAIVVFVVGVIKGRASVIEMFIAAVALAVAAVPEGLPAVVTISLAIGVQKMIRRNALIRKLPSVETLGATTVICTDKTGTLTKNEMTVTKLYVNKKVIDVSGSGYAKKGMFSFNKKIVNPKSFSKLLEIGALCNDARLDDEPIGDPTEISLIVSAAKAGIEKSSLDMTYKRRGELGFTSERKRMSTYHSIGGKKTVYCKGAPDIILELCDRILIDGKITRLTRQDKRDIIKINGLFANQALRVLGFAYKESSQLEEKDLIFVGLQGMIDPPREEVKEAIQKCKEAGIKVIMVTGDFIGTAKAIANEIGIEGKAITGQELEEIKHLEKKVEDIGVYARVNPEHKLKIIEALRKKGHIIAMTGDGVNDAPALKRADIGIAMGITGTDVSKEASDMILTDDNFASIVSAVEEGRGIFDNIRKFVEYLLSSNLGEVLTIFVAITIGLPLPLLAIHILWVNLVTDGLPALALGVDPRDKSAMQRKPRNPKEGVLPNRTIVRMFFIGIIMMLGTLGVFKYYNPGADLRYAQTAAFSTLMMFQMFNVLNCRSADKSLFKVGVFRNMWLWGAIIISVLLQVAVIHTPLNMFFKTVPLTAIDWVYVVLVSASVLVLNEIVKFLYGLRKKNES